MANFNAVVYATVSPARYTKGLPCNYTGELFAKDVNAIVNVPVTNAVGEAPTTGMLHWNPLRGYNHLVKLLRAIDFPGGLSTGVTVTAIAAPWVQVFGGTFTLPTLTFLIVGGAYPCGAIPVAPALQNTVSLARNAVGRLVLYSSTIGTTAAALSGTITAGAPSDLTNCGNFTAQEILQTSVTAKDKVENTPACGGVVALVGPDIDMDVMPVDYDRFDPEGNYAIGESLAVNTAGNPAVVVTPLVLNYLGAGVSYVSTGPRPYFLGSRLTVGFCNTNAVAGLVNYTVVPLYIQGDWGIGTYQLFAAGQTTRSAFLGVNGVSFDTFHADAPPVGYGWFGWYISSDTDGSVVSVREDVPALYDKSSIAAQRIFLFEGLALGQTISINYKAMVEGVPTGSIAAYVKGVLGQGTGRVATLQHLADLYTDPECPLRRVLSGAAYADLEKFSQEQLCIASKQISDVLRCDNMLATASNKRKREQDELEAGGMYSGGMYASGLDIPQMINTGVSLVRTLEPFLSAL